MKKLITILLTLAVLHSFGVSAMAAETEVTQYTWETVANDAFEIDADGVFIQVGTYCLWVPSFYVVRELTEDQTVAGYVANIEAADRSSAILVFTDKEETSDLNLLAKTFTNAGFEAEAIEVNGVPALLYVNPEADTINVMYLDGEANDSLTFCFYPYSDEAFAGLSYLMVSSIQPGLLWTTVADAAVAVDKNAQFIPISETGLAMWIPSAFSSVELTEEDIEEGYAAYLTTDDESAAVSILVWGEGYDLDSVLDFYLENGYENAQIMTINGIKAVLVEDEEDDCIMVDYPLNNGSVMEFTFTPISDDGFAQISYLMISSLQAAV